MTRRPRSRLAPVAFIRRRFVAPASLIGLVALAAIVGLAGPAGAHALRVDSAPEAGAVLKTSPTVVTVTFGEAPDPHLSSLKVLDSSGRNRADGPTGAVAGRPLALQVPLGHLGTGVYSVVWTTVSSVDGHLASGVFAFGVGVAAANVPATRTTSSAPAPAPSTTAARWLLYAGLMGLVGAAAVGLACFGAPRRPAWPWLFVVAWAAAVLGALGIGVGEAHSARVGLGHLFSSTFGHQIEVRLVPLLVGAALAALVLAVAPRDWRRRAAVAVLGLAGLVAMWGDVTDSHAAAAHQQGGLKMVEQWLHFVSAGVWIGGLATLLIGLVGLNRTRRGLVARRYSAMALAAVVVLAASGLLRAIDEVGSWHALVSTSFGRLILVKSGLLAVLVVLGARNRYRSVPQVEGSARPLVRLGRIELGLAAVVLVATAVLQGLAPPASSVGAAQPPTVVVTGQDFATTVKVRLSISPGTTGFNQFALAADDYDTGRAVVARPVTLTFSRPDQPSVGSSTLTLRRSPDGTYAASGPNLSIDGTWRVVVLIQQAATATEVDLKVDARPPPQHVTVDHSPGIPDLYTISLANDDSLQVYLDPGRPGLNEFHATYVGADGRELAMHSLAVTAAGPSPGSASTARRPLSVRKLDAAGHFVADLAGAVRGRYRFDLDARAADGSTFRSSVTIPVS
jgi:copper transport protein